MEGPPVLLIGLCQLLATNGWPLTPKKASGPSGERKTVQSVSMKLILFPPPLTCSVLLVSSLEPSLRGVWIPDIPYPLGR